MGVKFTPIVDDTVSAFTMGVKFTPIVNHIVDVEMVLSTMGVKFTPIVDKITASKLHFFCFSYVLPHSILGEVFLCYPEMLYPVWKKIGMSKFLIHHSWHITTSPLMA